MVEKGALLDPAYYPSLSAMSVGMAGQCPRCGQGELFQGFLGFHDACSSCGLTYSQADAGDGPAVFVIFITGTLAVAFAFILRFAFDAPLWLVLLLAVGLTLGLTLILLRPMKATLFALQYKNKAAEGRLEE
ncbi:MAG: DUF983 domain-containing protein [Pseudomonadota bacterium]